MANLLSAALIALFLASDPLPTSWLSVAGDIFWMISLIGVANLFPFRLGTRYSDGARIAMLLTSRSKSRRWISLMAVGIQRHAGVRPKNWRRTWLDAAGRIQDGSVDDFVGNWVAYAAAYDRKDAPVAASHLERCLGLVNLLGPSLQDVVALEAAVFTAWFRENAVIADKWLRQVKKIKTFPQLMQIRADIALHCARREFAPALSQWQRAFAFIEKLPPSPARTRLTEGLLEWRDEIQERQNSQHAQRHLIRKEFWTQFIEAMGRKSTLCQNISPSTDSWIGIALGITGISVNLVGGDRGNYTRVEIYINCGDAIENKKVFDFLFGLKDEIEKGFGASLVWERMEDRVASRIKYEQGEVSIFVKEDWPRMNDFLMDAAIRMHSAFKDAVRKVSSVEIGFSIFDQTCMPWR